MQRARLVPYFAAVASAAVTAAVCLVGPVRAAIDPPAPTSAFVPIVPCRLADTRPGSENVGPRATPLGADEIVPFTVRGTNGKCTIPQQATAIASNVTAVGATAASFVTLYPADAPARPTASNLNVTSGSSPTPNQVTVALSANGVVNAYNRFGSVDLIIDVVGYYTPNVPSLNTIPSGTTITGQNVYDVHVSYGEDIDTMYLDFGGRAPVPLTDETLRFPGGSVGQNDPACTGTYEAPTAPIGKVCVYVIGEGFQIDSLSAGPAPLADRGFFLRWRAQMVALDQPQEWLAVTWAYTAP